MSDFIPDDLLSNVLLRLPLQSLLRYRCVSRSWQALIDSPHFIYLHSKSRIKPFLNPSSDSSHGDDDVKVVALNHEKFYALEFNNAMDYSIPTAKHLNFPLEHPKSQIKLVGSCNGLICLTTPDSGVVFLNPWIQKYWELPSPQIEYSMIGQVSFCLGFGYEPDSDDYKVLKIVEFSDIFKESPSSSDHEVYVYSLKVNSWKRLIGGFAFAFQNYGRDVGAFANGALHWIVKEKEWDVKNSILAFDLRSEEFRLMPCPRNPDETFKQKLRILDGLLCLVSYYYSSGRFRADLWLMAEYGGGVESWKKLMSIKMPYGNLTFWNIRPISYLKNRSKVLLLIKGEKLVVYDLLTKSMEDINTEEITTRRGALATCLDARVCMGSLVRPNFDGGSGIS